MGDPPQSIINKRILKDCDLLVGVFWTRIGTPTDEYASGTVEEIEEHIKAGKPAMLYFSMARVAPDKIEPAQYEQLKKFRESCRTRGLYVQFTDVAEFKEQFARHLTIKLNTDAAFASISAPQQQLADEGASSVRNIPRITAEAQTLLKEASQDSVGSITRMPMRGSLLVQTNGKVLPQDSSAKTRATWEGAIKELEELGLIEAKGYKREIFAVTRKGYDAAALLPP